MKKVAIVGFGFMGRTHYGAWRKCRGAKVVASDARESIALLCAERKSAFTGRTINV